MQVIGRFVLFEKTEDLYFSLKKNMQLQRKKKLLITGCCLLVGILQVDAQETAKTNLLPKVDHAEPLFNDLMRDIGARKGEAEINVGFGVADHNNYTEYFGFIEYEWAIANRLGMEVEIPFSFNKEDGIGNAAIPNNRIEGIKLATQYTFYVNEKTQTSMAVAYIHEFELNYLKKLDGDGAFFTGMRMNPVFIIAKKFDNFNTTVFGGPVVEQVFDTGKVHVLGTLNASVLYQLPSSKNFIGIENNIDFKQDRFQYVLRPQIKVGLLHNLAVGFVTGIPVSSDKDVKMDFLTRIIWEP